MYTKQLEDLPGFSSSYVASSDFGSDVVVSPSAFQLATIRNIDAVIATTLLDIASQCSENVSIYNKFETKYPYYSHGVLGFWGFGVLSKAHFWAEIL